MEKTRTDIFALSLILCLYLLGCSLKHTSGNLSEIQVVRKIPFRIYKSGQELKVHSFDDTLNVYRWSDWKLYKFNGVMQFETNQPIPGTEPFFLYKIGDSTGYFYTSRDFSAKPQVLNKDSLLTKKGFATDYRASFPLDNDSMWQLLERKKFNDELVIKYVNRLPTEAMFDTCIYYFSNKLNGVDYSFSKKLDSITGMKLYKARFVYSSQFSIDYNLTIPSREFFFEMSMKVPNKKMVTNMIERFKKQAGIY